MSQGKKLRRGIAKGQRVLAHELVAKTAEGLAFAVYEELMKDNVWWAAWQAAHPGLEGEDLQRAFVRRTAPGMTRQARATLAKMLSDPQYEPLHASISEALILDNEFTRDSRRSIFRH